MALWKGGASVFPQNSEDNTENDITLLELGCWQSAEGPFACNLKTEDSVAAESLETPSSYLWVCSAFIFRFAIQLPSPPNVDVS